MKNMKLKSRINPTEHAEGMCIEMTTIYEDNVVKLSVIDWQGDFKEYVETDKLTGVFEVSVEEPLWWRRMQKINQLIDEQSKVASESIIVKTTPC